MSNPDLDDGLSSIFIRIKESLFQNLKSENKKDVIESLDEFLKYSVKEMEFDSLNKDNLREEVWGSIFQLLTEETYQTHHEKCLMVLRILGRDKTGLDEIVTLDRLNIVLAKAGLSKIESTEIVTSVTIEALKLLCNLLYNSTKVQNIIMETECIACIMNRINKYDKDTSHHLKLFDSKIIFLITALNMSARNIVKYDHKGDEIFIDLLDKLVPITCNERPPIPDNDVLVACEVLKVLFNLFISTKDCTVEEEERYENLLDILRKLLLCKNDQMQDKLQSNIVNLLTILPYKSCSMLFPVSETKNADMFQDMNMSAIAELLKFLDSKLSVKGSELPENLSPILTALIKLSKNARFIRKYIRLQVLPPLTEVKKRPEEGTSLRAKLCRLLTSVCTEIQTLVAEFIFVLCKENVNRMVKYTGYGNAAGMFANKGLLGLSSSGVVYSSESEDSETEEYEKYKDQINPVTGFYEGPKTNPLEGMSEEQKEYEAMKLLSLVDELTKKGVIHPCRIGEDGKPKPIEHVLELQEQLPKHQPNGCDSP